MLEQRVRLAGQMARFLKVATHLQQEMARLERRLEDGRSTKVGHHTRTVPMVWCSGDGGVRGEPSLDTAALPAGEAGEAVVRPGAGLQHWEEPAGGHGEGGARCWGGGPGAGGLHFGH